MRMPDNRALRVMSFNVRCPGGQDGEHAWERRYGPVIRVIQGYGTDVAGLQEPVRGQIEDLHAGLARYAWFGAGRLDGREAGEFTPIFYRQDRIQVLEQDTFWLSERPETPGSVGWDAGCVRIVTWGRLHDRLTDRAFFHFNTHFDHHGALARLQSAQLLLEAVARLAGPAPVVVTGDFNCTESGEPYRLLTGAGSARGGLLRLEDARHAARLGHHGPEFTFNAFGYPQALRTKIDHIFVANGVTVLRHGILSDAWRVGTPSDHLPVVAEIVFA